MSAQLSYQLIGHVTPGRVTKVMTLARKAVECRDHGVDSILADIMALSSASIVEKNSYSRALSPLVSISILFGPGERLYSKAHSWLGGVIFTFLLGGMTFVAIIGVFVRTTIDTWIQFSLYIVPLIALVSGCRVYTSSAFNKLLKRKLSRKSLVAGFVESDHDIPWHESQRASWLRKAAYKNCLYPFILEIYQWTAYVIFHTVFKSDTFAGSLTESHEVLEIDPGLWLVFYCFFWVMAMYITGFVSYSFILISRLTVRDVISFMCMFGDSPFLLYRPSEERNPVLESLSPLKRVLNAVTGFLFMDLFQTGKDIVLVYEKDAPVLSGMQVNPNPSNPDQNSVDEGEYWDPHEFHFSASLDVSGPAVGRIGVPGQPQVKPADACKYLSNVVGSIEVLAGLFQPFIVLLAFFSVANLVTHVGAIVSLVKNFKSSHWWTFVRTCIWLLLSMRLLWSAAGITKALSHVSRHLNYLWSIGHLQGDQEEWQRFFKLVETFQLRTKTYGFPLTMKQAASIATFINFALIIVLSVMKPSVHFPAETGA